MTFRKTEQTVEQSYTVEGPDLVGRFNVNSQGFCSRAIHDEDEKSAIDKHVASIPKPPTSWDAYEALKEVRESIGNLVSGPPLHTQTDLTEEDAIELMRLLGVLNRQCGWAATTDEEAVEAYADLVFSGGLTYGNNYEYTEIGMKVAQNWKEGGCS